MDVSQTAPPDEMRSESAQWDLVRISHEVENILQENYGELRTLSHPESPHESAT